MGNTKTALYAIIALALLLQSLIPQGFMPAHAAMKPFQIEICTASGLATITIDANKTRHGHDARHDACPFAPVLAFSFAVQHALVLRVMAAAAALTPPAFILPPAAVKAYFSQGPPVS